MKFNTPKGTMEGNWHEITGPNCQCECGDEKGNCNPRLRAILQSSIHSALQEQARGIVEMVRGMKTRSQKCSCGGSLIPAHGTGMVTFPYQCAECGSYTDDGAETDQILEKLASRIESNQNRS